MNCPQCQAANGPDSVFCGNCGVRLAPASPSGQAPPNTPSGWDAPAGYAPAGYAQGGYGAPGAASPTVYGAAIKPPPPPTGPPGHGAPVGQAPAGWGTPPGGQAPVGWGTPPVGQAPVGWGAPPDAQETTRFAPPAGQAPVGWGAPPDAQETTRFASSVGQAPVGWGAPPVGQEPTRFASPGGQAPGGYAPPGIQEPNVYGTPGGYGTPGNQEPTSYGTPPGGQAPGGYGAPGGQAPAGWGTPPGGQAPGGYSTSPGQAPGGYGTPPGGQSPGGWGTPPGGQGPGGYGAPGGQGPGGFPPGQYQPGQVGGFSQRSADRPGAQPIGFNLNRLTTADRIVAGGTLITMIALFLPWYSGTYSAGGLTSHGTVSGTGTHGWLWIEFLLALALLAYLAARAAWERLPFNLPVSHELLLIAVTGLQFLLILIGFFVKPPTNGLAGFSVSWAFGSILALLAAIVAATPVIYPAARTYLDSRKSTGGGSTPPQY